MQPSVTRLAAPLLAFLGVVTLASCLEPSPDCEALAADIEVTVTAGAMTPSDPAVCRGDAVTLQIASEVDGFVHVHGFDDDELPAIPVAAGETVEVRFAAVRSGQFPVEVHPQDDPAGVSIGLLTIHEP